VVPLLCSVLSFGFALLLLGRLVRRGRWYYAAWGLGLVWFGISTAAEWAGAAFGWNATLYRLWYLSGAIGVAAYLGAGSVYIHRSVGFAWLVVGGLVLGCVPAVLAGYVGSTLAGLVCAVALVVVVVRLPRQFAHAVFGTLLLGSALAARQILTAPVNLALLPVGDQIATGQAFASDVRILTPLFNIPGALALLLGAVASGLHYWRTRSAPGYLVSNVLIALGALVPSLTSGLTRFGWSSAFYLGELVGVVCLLAGFIVRERTSAPPTPRPSLTMARPGV
jgi:hypothetical protein